MTLSAAYAPKCLPAPAPKRNAIAAKPSTPLAQKSVTKIALAAPKQSTNTTSNTQPGNYRLRTMANGITAEQFTLPLGNAHNIAYIQLAKINGQWHWATGYSAGNEGSGYYINANHNRHNATKKQALKNAATELQNQCSHLPQIEHIKSWCKTMATQKLNQQQQLF